MLASAVFGMPVCLYTIDKEEYLNETYIVGCKNPNEQKINLAKVGKRFYCVLDTTLHTDIKFIKEYLIEEVIFVECRSLMAFLRVRMRRRKRNRKI